MKEAAVGMDAGDAKERLGAVIAVKNKRIEELEDALRKIVRGPDGEHKHESGCAFEKFACGIAYDALEQLPPIK